jgi:hypothetical protein
LSQTLKLIRMAQQGLQPTAKQVARGLMAGKQQHGALGQQLRPALELARSLGLHQAAGQIVPGVWRFWASRVSK